MAKIGIVGTGWGARVQVPAFREAGLEVVAIAGHNPERTREVAHELALRAFDDWRELVASRDIDLISIVTPPSEHVEMALAALKAGRHILTEKPTALNAKEAEKLRNFASKKPKQLALVDHELRFLPAWREARKRISDLGPIRYAEVRYSSPARGDRSREWNWWSDANRGGGIWGAVGSHFVDALRYFGMEIEEVQGLMHTSIAERSGQPVTSDDVAAVNMRLNSGGLAVMTFNAAASGPDEASVLTLHGEHSAMRFVSAEVLFARRGQSFTRIAGGEMDPRPGNSLGGAFGSGTLWLGRALRLALDEGRREELAPAATLEDGLAQQEVLDAARKSSATGGKWVKVRAAQNA